MDLLATTIAAKETSNETLSSGGDADTHNTQLNQEKSDRRLVKQHFDKRMKSVCLRDVDSDQVFQVAEALERLRLRKKLPSFLTKQEADLTLNIRTMPTPAVDLFASFLQNHRYFGGLTLLLLFPEDTPEDEQESEKSRCRETVDVMFRALARNQHRQVVKHEIASSILPSKEVFREFVISAKYQPFPWLCFGAFGGLQGEVTLTTPHSSQNHATELTFPQYFCDKIVFPDLLSAFSNAGCVTRLEAIFDDFTENADRAFVETLQQYVSTTTTLRELKLKYFGGVDVFNITPVLQSLHSSPLITKLSLHGGWILDPVNEDSLPETRNESVTHLSYCGNFDHLFFFAGQVEYLKLGFPDDWEESVIGDETLFRYLRCLTLEQNCLKQLDIANNTLPEGFLPKLIDLLKDSPGSLDSLSLGCRGRDPLNAATAEVSEDEDSYEDDDDSEDDDSEEEQDEQGVGPEDGFDMVLSKNAYLPENDVLHFFGCLSMIRLKYLSLYYTITKTETARFFLDNLKANKMLLAFEGICFDLRDLDSPKKESEERLFKAEMDYYLSLNRRGQISFLQQATVSLESWSDVVAEDQVDQEVNLSAAYYFVRARPKDLLRFWEDG